MNIELRLWSGSEVNSAYVNAHNKSRSKYYSSQGERKFDKSDIEQQIRDGLEKGDCYFYGVYQVNCHDLIGTVKIQHINKKNKTGDVVPFIFNEQYFKYKLGAQIIKLGCKIAFDEFNLRKIFGGVSKSNIGSVKTFLKSNYVVEGIRKGHLLEDGIPIDEILVACFNKKFFNKAHFEQYDITFEDIYAV